ncbi:MSHA biogenesis protein MshI [Cellvibrio sp.]|uniref:MSHA biogenesis protein MshI n=1 Tax=Cellvibrio sp. TaxID=1965322 RepID=UPI0039648C97
MQQINLYLPEFRPNREPVRAIHMLWAGLAFIVLLIAFSIYSNHQYKLLEQQLTDEKAAQHNMLAQLQAIAARKPAQTSAQLDAKIAQLQKNLQRHNQILSMISHQDLGNDKGFSAQVGALGQASLNTMSLESFSLQKGGKYAELKGLTRTADQIPLYLQRLRKDPAFSEVGFGVLTMERDIQTGLLKFSLAKAKDEKDVAGGKR